MRRKTTKTLPVSTRGWTDDEVTEFHDLLDAALAVGRSSTDRIDECVRLMTVARHESKSWVKHADRDLFRVGVTSLMSKWAQRVRHVEVVRHDGKTITKPAVRGTSNRDEESGDRWVEQSLVATWTWDQLREKRAEAIKVITSYRDDLALYDAYLALHERVPDAANPQEALKSLGLTEEQWLGDPGRRTA